MRRHSVKILLVEDETKIANLVSRALQEDLHSVSMAHNGLDGLHFVDTAMFDLIILDVMLPGLSGLEVARKARQRGNKTPILMLTARDTVPDIVAGLDAGADDYLTKPFSLEELLARVRAVSRRGPVPQSTRLAVRGLVMDPASHEVTRGGKPIGLTKREYRLLELLMRNAGRVVKRDTIMESVWSEGESIENNTLDAFISLLRTKVDSGRKERLIRTVRGIGYRLG
jgi:DNA-binding response OmpR family regulator